MDGLKRSVIADIYLRSRLLSWVIAERIQRGKWPESEACRPPRTCRCESEQKAISVAYSIRGHPFPYTPNHTPLVIHTH